MENMETFGRLSSVLIDQHNEFSGRNNHSNLPNTDIISALIRKIRAAVLPGYFTGRFNGTLETKPLSSRLPSLLDDIYWELQGEIKKAFLIHGKETQMDEENAGESAASVSRDLLEELVNIQKLLYKDAEAGFNGDPAAQGIDEIILTYPGFFAVFVYRIAHFLYKKKVPYIPRIMSEYAHGITGIDIHPGAIIGEYFFIDHGTGVVIGETTIIGNNVKLYQGVTLGAISTKSGQKLAGKKRHPTIEDNVTIYSGASILGGETIIGRNSTIGGNVFIVKSVPKDTVVKGIKQEDN